MSGKQSLFYTFWLVDDLPRHQSGVVPQRLHHWAQSVVQVGLKLGVVVEKVLVLEKIISKKKLVRSWAILSIKASVSPMFSFSFFFKKKTWFCNTSRNEVKMICPSMKP